MHIQLDPIGGVAGDMFAAAMLDAFPQLEAGVVEAVTAVAPVDCRLAPHGDGVLHGQRFVVSLEAGDLDAHRHDNHHHGHAARHGHRHWASIRDDLLRAALAPDVRETAIAIFAGLAKAEAAVHGIDVEVVAFHEVGAWDSIADIVAAAVLIARCGASSWSVGPLPLGSGRVETAHGPLPIPAPATALLLRGLSVIDDGIAGERVTPTGAAILHYLVGSASSRTPSPRVARTNTLGRSGIGFGARRLPGLSNCLRVLVLDEMDADAANGEPAGAHRELAVIEFEVDDQSAEDLAMGLDRLRAHRDIFDVVQMPVFGKKGRMMTHVRVLARAGAGDAVAACFRETTTIGLRHRSVDGVALPRSAGTVEVAGRPVRIKTVERPGGERTVKAEADDAMSHETHAGRARLRREAEQLALEMMTKRDA